MVSLGSLGEGSAGTDHTCWVQFTGRRYCWGWRGNGQLGDGSMETARVETPEAGPDGEPEWASIATGWYTTCGLTTAGEIWCWGTNMGGCVGIDPDLESAVPTPHLLSDTMRFTKVAFGGFHGCGIRDDGSLWCWGLNSSGQLGVGDTEDRFEPTESGCTESECFGDWVAVAAGSFHTCAIREGGRLYCWGGGLNGQLGIGVIPDRDLSRAVPVAGRWRAVDGGQSHTCAIADDETLFCWGRNDLGQLGLGDLMRRDAPARVTVPGGDGFLRLGLGREHTCVVRRDETLWCWGWNEDGQLGAGFETTAAELPVTAPQRVCFPG
jgi:alpha-tubulin suppressor-like RCC1 family protein